ncbi:MAG: transglutaminase TgpA family protein [Gammaproteobacteria bacterium]
MKKRPSKDRRKEPAQGSLGQLLWLASALFVAALPHLPYIALWVPLLVSAVASWRLLAAGYRWPLPSAWVRIPLALSAFTGVVLTYRQVTGVDAGSALLLIMATMKLLETRGQRDRAVVVFLCFFLLFSAFLREQALWAPAYLLFGVLVLISALLQVTRADGTLKAGTALAVAGRLLIQALPLAALFFLLFPRIPGPFWSLPQRGSQAMTGLAESMSPGDITELALSDAIAFRVRFDGEVPPSSDLYWRGPVLTEFDGREWEMRALSFFPNLTEQLRDEGPSTRYEITLEPHGRRWLLALETPIEWTADAAVISAPYQLMRFRPIEQRTRYRARSLLSGATPGIMTERGRNADLKLPAESNPRSLALASAMRANATDDAGYLDAVLRMFREQPFFYSLTPSVLGAQSVDDFLFNTREGFCGHYASAFAVMARAAGIPARVVTGYQGGELNPLAKHWIVRQGDAHAWAEVWLKDRWLRYDPTAAVAPERIEWGMDGAMSRGSVAGVGEFRQRFLSTNLYMSWDAVNAAWNRWVLAFGPESQSDLLRWTGVTTPSLRHLVVGLAIGMIVLLGLAGAWHYHQLQGSSEPLLRAYRQLCRRTATIWRARMPAEGPQEYATAVGTVRPDLATELNTLFGAYARLRYDGSQDTRRVSAFSRAVRRFRPARRPPDSRD